MIAEKTQLLNVNFDKDLAMVLSGLLLSTKFFNLTRVLILQEIFSLSSTYTDKRGIPYRLAFGQLSMLYRCRDRRLDSYERSTPLQTRMRTRPHAREVHTFSKGEENQRRLSL